jgi:hypothetical protein
MRSKITGVHHVSDERALFPTAGLIGKCIVEVEKTFVYPKVIEVISRCSRNVLEEVDRGVGDACIPDLLNSSAVGNSPNSHSIKMLISTSKNILRNFIDVIKCLHHGRVMKKKHPLKIGVYL